MTEVMSPNRAVICPSYLYRYDEKQWKDQKPYPPNGTLVAAAYLKQAGYTISFFDTHLAYSPADLIDLIDQHDPPKYLIIYDDGFNYLTKMCLSIMREVAFKLIDIGKKHNCTIIVCNSDATDHYETYLQRGADFVIHGEGEITLKVLLDTLATGSESYELIQGISYIKNQKILKNPSRPVLQDLDLLPDPAWNLIDMDAYKKIWEASQGYFSLNVATTRGCPFKCNWCAKPIYGNRYNARSAQRVVQELKFLVSTFEVKHIWMADDIFGLNIKWLEQFRSEIDIAGLTIQYKIQSRADLLVIEKYVDLLKESGCTEVWIGAESGSQKILDAMDKGITIDQIKSSTLLLRNNGIKVGYFLQFGYLGESLQDIKSTIHMLLSNMPDDIGISISYPLPGTLFFEKVKTLLGSKKNWQDSDDLDMMYHAPFSPAFYKRLHRLVHKLFRLKQGWLNFLSLITGQKKLTKSILKSIASVFYYFPAAIADRLKLARLLT